MYIVFGGLKAKAGHGTLGSQHVTKKVTWSIVSLSPIKDFY